MCEKRRCIKIYKNKNFTPLTLTLISLSLHSHWKVVNNVLIPTVLCKGGKDATETIDTGSKGLVKGSLTLSLWTTLFLHSFYCGKLWQYFRKGDSPPHDFGCCIIFSGTFFETLFFWSNCHVLPHHIMQLDTWLITGCLMSKCIMYLNGALSSLPNTLSNIALCTSRGRMWAEQLVWWRWYL